MSVARHRREVANAEALFNANLAETHRRMQLLIGEVRAAATPLRLGVGAAITGAVLYFVRPRAATLLRIPVIVGAVNSLVQHFSHSVGDELLWETDPRR